MQIIPPLLSLTIFCIVSCSFSWHSSSICRSLAADAVFHQFPDRFSENICGPDSFLALLPSRIYAIRSFACSSLPTIGVISGLNVSLDHMNGRGNCPHFSAIFSGMLDQHRSLPSGYPKARHYHSSTPSVSQLPSYFHTLVKTSELCARHHRCFTMPMRGPIARVTSI